ncbi:unnamed protein product [Allacma fusca]|uniref:BTB domain-containing protein n=1 Tax=Allacma fusca TaxID=39272 RepID=A0A8J2LT76_9HEXA|nr:unnamed protein product [Allacma fusca]
MDNIFVGCRKGDLGRVKYLVEQKEVELNVRDNWDSTPLYYACLCGHTDLVKYLLENGAKCEANTFDGERCLYGALTSEVRKLLLDAKVITAQTKRRDDYDIFCEKILKAEDYSDITFLLEGNSTFKLHRCILSVRSDNFKSLLQSRWKDRPEIRNHMIESKVFEEFLKYVYTSRIVCQRDRLDSFYRLADQCQMPQLRAELDSAVVKAESFEGSKKGVRVSTISVESEKALWELQQAYGQLLEQGIPPEFSSWPPANVLPLMPTLPSSYFDMCLLVDGYRFYCHKVFVCVRSGYFNAMLHFNQNQLLEDNIPILKIVDFEPEVMTCVLYYIYTNNAQLSDDVVLDVLRSADMYLLSGLKRQCGAFLSNKVTVDNVMMLFQLARMYDLPRLENRCTEFIATNIDTIRENEEFQKAVVSDAAEVKGRQDTDSIQIIDDIRYHITSGVQTFSEVADANEKLRIIDDILESLGLEA